MKSQLLQNLHAVFYVAIKEFLLQSRVRSVQVCVHAFSSTPLNVVGVLT